MNNFGGINNAGDARRAHLALVDGTNTTARPAAALGAESVARTSAVTPTYARTGFASNRTEAPRTRHENGVRAVAQLHATFDEALQPMVLASGVSHENASRVADAIRSNPSLLAQAERAYQRARINAV